MNTFPTSAMDAMTIGCLAVAAGHLPASLLPMVVRVAAELPESCLTPQGVLDRLTRLGMACHHEVYPDSDMADRYGSLTANCRWALVWMDPDDEHDTRWWAICHLCESKTMAITVFTSPDPDRCYCSENVSGWTGHAVVVESLPADCCLSWPRPAV